MRTRRRFLVATAILVPALAAAGAIAPVALAQNASPAGHWVGAIELPGSPLEVNVDLVLQDDAWSGDISIPSQGGRDVPLIEIQVDGASVRFTISGVGGDPTFAGTLDGETIRGDFTQGGQSFPFTLTRGDDIAARAATALQDIDAEIESALEDLGVPGLAIAVVAADEVVLARGYGSRNVSADDAAVTPDTLFAIGSTTKAFTAFLLGMLVDEGALEWDAPVIDYLPDFRLQDVHATLRLKVRDLLIHSSGLPRHDAVWYNSTATRDEIFARLAHLEPTRDLGEEFQYQNMMFMTAGYLAERVTGQSWEELVETRIFAPLGMERSNFSVVASQQDPDHALPHAVEDRAATRIPFRNIDTIGPAGSINSSVTEMSRWIRMQLGGGAMGGTRLVQEATLREMHSPQMAISGYPGDQRVMTLGYGMGWMLESHRGHFLVQHGGGIDGFISWVALLPHERLGVVVYTNASGLNPLPTAVARTVIDRVLGLDDGGYLDRAREQARQAEEAAAAAADNATARRQADTSPSHALDAYVGTYDHPGYGAIAVSMVGERLRLVYNDMPVDLEHWHFDTFNGADADGDPALEDVKFLFRLDADGAISELVVTLEPLASPTVFGRRPEDRLSDPEYLQRFVGAYELDTQRAAITLSGDRLQVSLPGQPTYTLDPKQGTEFSLRGMQGFSVEFLVDTEGGVTGLRFIQPNGIFEATRVRDE